MDAHKRINVWIPEDIYQKLISMKGTLKNNLCTILAHQFNENAHSLHTDAHDTDDLYNEIYSNFYNIEVIPLKKDVNYLKKDIDQLNIFVSALQKDKTYLMQQNNALLLVKMPLLARIKMKLLEKG